MNAPAMPAAGAPWPRRIALSLLALAVLAAIVWLRRHEPSYADRIAPVRVAGADGERVVARDFAARVDLAGLRVARTLRAPSPHLFVDEPVEIGTPGIWLVVPATVETLREPAFVSALVRSRDDLNYQSSGSDRPKVAAANLDSRIVAAGLPEDGAYFFELPPGRLEGARLLLFRGSTPGSNDAVIDLDLGIDAARAQALLRGAGVHEVAP